MDRTLASEAEDAGSIPAGSTVAYNQTYDRYKYKTFKEKTTIL